MNSEDDFHDEMVAQQRRREEEQKRQEELTKTSIKIRKQDLKRANATKVPLMNRSLENEELLLNRATMCSKRFLRVAEEHFISAGNARTENEVRVVVGDLAMSRD